MAQKILTSFMDGPQEIPECPGQKQESFHQPWRMQMHKKLVIQPCSLNFNSMCIKKHSFIHTTRKRDVKQLTFYLLFEVYTQRDMT